MNIMIDILRRFFIIFPPIIYWGFNLIFAPPLCHSRTVSSNGSHRMHACVRACARAWRSEMHVPKMHCQRPVWRHLDAFPHLTTAPVRCVWLRASPILRINQRSFTDIDFKKSLHLGLHDERGQICFVLVFLFFYTPSIFFFFSF